ncbi:MAG: winged helix-turn-helix transcriptional regulator, partial [Lachnospiraceae bacterium]|nr:winged helix-turn-helix transcriptional regulator [Lachnospiraceae bacterium]
MDIALTKSERVIKHVHEMILGGELSKGDMLPSENELSAICDVSRVTTRKALAMLADMGLIETRRGVGSFVVVDSIPGENARERSKLIS